MTASAFFDSGSQRTFITEKLARDLKIDCSQKERINISGFGSLEMSNCEKTKAETAIECVNNAIEYLTVNTVPQTTAQPIQCVQTKDIDRQLAKKMNALTKVQKGLPQTLIGADQMFKFLRLPHTSNEAGFQLLQT